MIVYLYDLKPKKQNSLNRLKRKFYYHFNKIRLKEFVFKTKSVFAADERYEKLLDGFFTSFKGELEVYKIRTEGVEQLG